MLSLQAKSEGRTTAPHHRGYGNVRFVGGQYEPSSIHSYGAKRSNMAKVKSLEDLKVERTTVKRLFLRLTNHIMRTDMDISVEELEENFKRLTVGGSKGMEANEELEVTYNAADAKGALSDQQKTDIKKKEKE
ncbi:hypothetical protein CRENBAI_018920 [Crenichthys baileyi]|uniref:Uncharacterized protein n=1 Tax=Crenichthys baileyi TaxID=28760 RepID=A0AAV9SNK5_9TELE